MENCELVLRFGQNVRRWRRQHGWSQQQLAERADLERSYISDIERGSRNPTLGTVARVAAALQADPLALLAPVEVPVEAPVDAPLPSDEAPVNHPSK